MARALIPNSTQIPDIILDHWMAELSDAEFKVLLYVARRTFGFGKDSDNISLTQLTSGIRRRDGTPLDRGTGLSRSGVKKACKGLIERGVLIRFRNTAPDGRESEESTYRLNLFASLPESEDEVGRQKTYPGHVVAYPDVGHKVAQVGHKRTEGRPRSRPGVGHQVAPQETAQETEQETASAESGADDELIETLVREGVGRSTAVRLAGTKPDMCRRYLEWLPFADVKTSRGSWLANAIEHEYGPPRKLPQRGAVAGAGRGDQHRRPPSPRDQQDRGGNALASLRVRYAQLERSRPDAMAEFEAYFAADQAKTERFAETLTEKGRKVFFEQSGSEEFRLFAFDRWVRAEGRKYVEAAQPDATTEHTMTAMRAAG
jgi:hypothetical protein